MAPLLKRAVVRAGHHRVVQLLVSAFVVTSYFTAMHLYKGAALVASAPLLVVAKDVDVSWHPPADNQVNDLDSALHSDGVYGFIFDSSETPEGQYGAYNLCNMPHVRKTEYVKPSAEYELQYVELVSLPIPTSATRTNLC